MLYTEMETGIAVLFPGVQTTMTRQRTTLLLLLAALSGYAADRKIAPDLANLPPDQHVSVIVRYKQAPVHRNRIAVERRGGVLEALPRYGQELRLLRACLRAGRSDQRSDVEYDLAGPHGGGHARLCESAINAGIARQYGWNGNGITVAVIDSGIMDTHPDLQDGSGKSRVVYAETFNFSEGNDYFDRYGHGTHVAAILGGDASQSAGSQYTHTFCGIAPKVRFVSLKVLDRQGAGTDSAVIAAIQRAIALKDTYNIRVINLSLGRPVMESYSTDPLCQAVEQAWKAGIVVVVAAGNEGRNNSKGSSGYATITSPGNDPYVITVGAMKDAKTISRADDQIASYSSKGSTLFDQVVKPDLVAPGNKIISALPAGLALTNTYPGKKSRTAITVRAAPSGSDWYFD